MPQRICVAGAADQAGRAMVRAVVRAVVRNLTEPEHSWRDRVSDSTGTPVRSPVSARAATGLNQPT
jgi:hypothetical protein